MSLIVNHCVMPKDGVNVKTTNTTPSDITFTGLTAGVKYHASVVCYMLSTSGNNPRLRLTTNGSDSGLSVRMVAWITSSPPPAPLTAFSSG